MIRDWPSRILTQELVANWEAIRPQSVSIGLGQKKKRFAYILRKLLVNNLEGVSLDIEMKVLIVF